MKDIKVGIIGGGGYVAGELIRLLLNHPQVKISFVHSKSHAGQPLDHVHHDLTGQTDLKFSGSINQDTDIIFLSLGHGASQIFMDKENLSPTTRQIDMSQDFRLNPEYVYGLSECYRDKIRIAKKIANPGCFATAILLGLMPLVAHAQLHDDIHISAITGSSGAGQQMTETTHFTWRDSNVSVYKAFEHQHLAEIKNCLTAEDRDIPLIHFLPFRGNFTRGILTAMYTQTGYTLNETQQLYQIYYQDSPFVHVSQRNPDIKMVVNTNNCLIHLQKHENTLLIITVIDNLLKGAAGQAIQNMNLMFNLDEDCGLHLKASAF